VDVVEGIASNLVSVSKLLGVSGEMVDADAVRQHANT
jgi:hypothetical protein